MKPKPNNYFHVRVYTDEGGKLEFFRDKKQPSSYRRTASRTRITKKGYRRRFITNP